LENAMTVTGAVGFESSFSVSQDVTLGDSETDQVFIKGQTTLGVSGDNAYSVTRRDPAANETAGALLMCVPRLSQIRHTYVLSLSS
tara:strand:- start:369 stop:626 length:258 start_codon:yes stop_codon:yes gene_type:complete